MERLSSKAGNKNLLARLRSRQNRTALKTGLLFVCVSVLLFVIKDKHQVKLRESNVTEVHDVREPILGSTIWNPKEFIIYEDDEDDADENEDEYGDPYKNLDDDTIVEMGQERQDIGTEMLELEQSESDEQELETTDPYKEQDAETLFQKLDIAQIEERMRRMRNYVTSACQRLRLPETKLCQVQQTQYQLKTLNRENLVYCTVEKSGSTFWLRILKVLGDDFNGISNPLTYKTGEAYSGNYRNLMLTPWESIKTTLNNNNKNVMFVRDPYSRIFSAWLDKLYSTNPYYWSTLGRKIIAQERLLEGFQPMSCGHDVTFAEFVQYLVSIVNEKDCIDPHFSANYLHCLPCNLTYNYIGTHEHLIEDTLYILHSLNLSRRITFTNIDQAGDLDAIMDASKWVFSNKLAIQPCMSFMDGLRRVWTRLQARGVLSKKSVFDQVFSNVNVGDLTEEDFRAILHSENQMFSYEERSKNREEALAEAFRTVPLNVLNDYVRAFMIDFEIFGYDFYPDFLSSPPLDNFQYFK